MDPFKKTVIPKYFKEVESRLQKLTSQMLDFIKHCKELLHFT